MLSLTRQAIVNSIQKRDCIRGNVLDIQCEDVDAITFKDIIELYLLLCRVKNWQWSGPLEGQSAARQSFAVICANLVRDIVSWPFIYLKHLRRVSRLSGQTGVTAALTDVTSILFLRSDHWFNIRSGGSVGHLRGVIYGFRSLGCKVNVVSSDVLMGVEASRDFYLCAPGYALGRNVPNVPELLYNDRLSEFIEKKWEELAISFVYQRYSLGNYTGVLLRKKYGVPYVCEYNGSFSWVSIHWEGRKLFHDKLLTRIEMLNLQAADLIVVVSRALYDELVSRGISPNKILVNPNGVDPEKYLPEVDGSAIRTKYGLEDKTVIGFIGTFGQWHGAEVLAEAFGRLIRSFPEYREKVCLFMIGDGPTMPLVKEILAKYSVADACVL
ncbi:MAG: glycosyltransferase, partial [Nitrospirota bacterium]|nr:glycosyltransferase [Nitrospirota bacterium]